MCRRHFPWRKRSEESLSSQESMCGPQLPWRKRSEGSPSSRHDSMCRSTVDVLPWRKISEASLVTSHGQCASVAVRDPLPWRKHSVEFIAVTIQCVGVIFHGASAMRNPFQSAVDVQPQPPWGKRSVDSFVISHDSMCRRHRPWRKCSEDSFPVRSRCAALNFHGLACRSKPPSLWRRASLPEL